MCFREAVLVLCLFGIISLAQEQRPLTDSLLTSVGDVDLITDLPGLTSQPTFKQYSGYLRGSTDNYQLHYWFVEAVGDHEKAPLILWLNGGPGCSSLEGLLDENGPFTVKENARLDYNPQSWNKFANMLYLEAPAGVGFSFAKNGNLTTDDDLTSLNSYHALLHFLEKFPAYKDRDFFITGESYGGVYVPTLALRVLGDKSNGLNLKGIAVGNGLTSYKLNDNSLVYFINYHGLLDESTWYSSLKTCCGNQCANKCMFTDTKSAECEKKIGEIDSSLSGLNIYNLYAPCAGGVPQAFANRFMHGSLNKKNINFRPELDNLFRDVPSLLRRNKFADPNLGMAIPCVDDSRIFTYLNNREVRKALHVDFDFLSQWDVCSEAVYSMYGRTYQDLSDAYLEVLRQNTRVMLFAGDTDMACNFMGILWFVDNLGLKPVRKMQHWHYIDLDGTRQVGGVYKNFALNSTFLHYVTVRGSGHMVPTDKPIAAYHLITRFIKDLSV